LIRHEDNGRDAEPAKGRIMALGCHIAQHGPQGYALQLTGYKDLIWLKNRVSILLCSHPASRDACDGRTPSLLAPTHHTCSDTPHTEAIDATGSMRPENHALDLRRCGPTHERVRWFLR